MRFFERNELQFECTGCGRCCRRPGVVYFTQDEIEAASRWLGLTPSELRENYSFTKVDGRAAIEVEHDSACGFLAGDRCTIHPARPAQCRTYPFWPELLESAGLWEAEKRHCEGIGCGPVYPPERILRLEREEGETGE